MEILAEQIDTKLGSKSKRLVAANTDASTALSGGVAVPGTVGGSERFNAPRETAAMSGNHRARGLLSGAELKTGCVPRNEFLDKVFNRGLAAIMFLAILPLFLTIAGLVLLCSGRPIFYSGARLGKDRQLFNILKFRSLDTKTAARVTGNKTLPRQNTTVTKIGRYLRNSRLDELPQLVNILRGDMVFFGPRPVRPEVEGIYAVSDPSHLIRFTVRPGLVGMSQAIMSHETPKAIRARFNRMCCKTEIHYGYMLGFVALVGFHVLNKARKVAFGAIMDCFNGLSDHSWLTGAFNKPRNCRVELDVDGEIVWGAVAGVSDEVLQFVSTQPVPPGRYNATVVLKKSNGRTRKGHMVFDLFVTQPCGVGQIGFASFCNYSTVSDASRHFSERYLLQSAVIPS